MNADDFGLSRGITDGIVAAHLEGIVTSTSLMANQAASEYAIEQMRHAPRLGVGVHLSLCEGRPVLPPDRVRTLIGADGMFLPPPTMIGLLSRWKVSGKELQAEFQAQIRWIKERGVNPTHVDSHHHLHLYAAAVGPYRRALLAEGIRCSRAPRHRHFPGSGLLGPHAGSVHRRAAVTLYMEYAQRFGLAGLTLPDACVVADPRYQREWREIGEGWKEMLLNLDAGTYEMGCHPGFHEAGFSETDSISERRELEFRVLTGRALKDAAEERGVELISYSRIGTTEHAEERTPVLQ